MSDTTQTPAPAPRDEPEQLHDSLHAAPSPHDPPAAEPRNDAKDAHDAPDAPLDLKTLTDRALHFLATASNETLGACLAGLGAGTYLVLGRVGLLLIGVVAGVVLHATWEGNARGEGAHAAAPEGRRRELGVDVAHRVLDWRDARASGREGGGDESDMAVRLYSGRELDYSDFRPETAAALTELTDAVIRDYVKWWYAPILPGESSFPASCRQTLTAFVLSMSTHLSRKRPADNLVDFVTRSSSFMIIFFQELSNAILASPGDTAGEAVDLYLKMKRDSTLANILDSDYQMKQFSNAAEDILQNYLEPKTYNCKPAQTFLKQILAKVVLEMIVVSCSKPEWINGWIVYMLEEGEPELMNAIDAGVEGSSGQLQNVKNEVERRQAESPVSPRDLKHKRVVSQAQEAMDDAMKEAQRLSQMIAEEDAKRLQEKLQDKRQTSSSTLNDDQSESTTQGVVTPTSSQSETVENEANDLGISNLPLQASSQVDTHSPARVEDSPKHESQRSFTSFDQLVPNAPPTALMSSPPPAPPPLTLHNGKMSIFDDSVPGEINQATIKSKPQVEYLIQIEPASHHHTGWMTARKFTDFETLHEVLRRIAAVTGAIGFTEVHAALPHWKGRTKAALRADLESYLNDAVKYKSLAESEGMKRFLEKEMGSGRSPGSKGFPGIGWPGQTFENMGKGMIDALTKAPQGVAGGGKALFGGVTGVLGSVTTPLGKKNNRDSVSATNSPGTVSRAATTPTPPVQNRHGRAESTVSELPTHIRTESIMSSAAKRTSSESLRNPNSPVIDQQPQREAPMERRPSYNPDGDGRRSGKSSVYGASRSNSRAPSVRDSVDLSPLMGGDQILNLPPMPSDIPDDYSAEPRPSLDPFHSRHPSRASTTSLSLPTEPVPPLPRRPSAISLSSSNPAPTSAPPATTTSTSRQSKPRNHAPLSEQETTVLIELFFAVINELYTLSSAWTLRRTLLNAAKTFLLRPGNPQLASITALLQSTVLEDNTSDAGVAYHVRKIRANALPTEDELKAWPADMGAEEKERLRVKARRLLVDRGMPQALTSVMGQAASGEALGKVFDAVQEPRVARGVVFGLVLQGLRGVTQ